MTNTAGEKELKSTWPVTSGTAADEKHEDRQVNLVAEGIDGIYSTVSNKDQVGL